MDIEFLKQMLSSQDLGALEKEFKRPEKILPQVNKDAKKWWDNLSSKEKANVYAYFNDGSRIYPDCIDTGTLARYKKEYRPGKVVPSKMNDNLDPFGNIGSDFNPFEEVPKKKSGWFW